MMVVDARAGEELKWPVGFPVLATLEMFDADFPVPWRSLGHRHHRLVVEQITNPGGLATAAWGKCIPVILFIRQAFMNG